MNTRTNVAKAAATTTLFVLPQCRPALRSTCPLSRRTCIPKCRATVILPCVRPRARDTMPSLAACGRHSLTSGFFNSSTIKRSRVWLGECGRNPPLSRGYGPMYRFPPEVDTILSACPAFPMRKKTYNTKDSPVVTDLSTSLALTSLTRGERTGSRTFSRIWSYVTVRWSTQYYIVPNLTRKQNQPPQPTLVWPMLFRGFPHQPRQPRYINPCLRRSPHPPWPPRPPRPPS